MGKNTNNQTNRSLLDSQRTSADSSYGNFNSNANQDYENARSTAGRVGQGIETSYSNPNSFLPSGALPNSSGWFNNPTADSAGAYASFDPNGDFSKARTGYEGFANTGGRENYADSSDSYKNFVNNGGIGESEASAIRNRATAQIPAFYQAYSDANKRRSNVQGGYSPGFDAQQEELGREQGREGFNAERQVEGDIASMRQSGREFGTSGLYGIDSSVAGNKLAGLGGITNIGQAGQQNEQFNAGQSQQNNQFNTSKNAAFQDAMTKLYTQNNQNATAGLQNYYSSSPGDRDSSRASILAGLGEQTGNQLQNLGLRSNIQDRTWQDYLTQIIGAGAGGLAGLGGGTNSKIKLPGTTVPLPRY